MCLTNCTVWGNSPCKTALTSDISHKFVGPQDHHHFKPAGCEFKDPSLGLIIHWRDSSTHWKLLCSWLIKDIENQPKEEMHKAESGRVQMHSFWLSSPCGITDSVTSSGHNVWGYTQSIANQRNSFEHLVSRVFIKAYLCPTHVTTFQSPAPHKGQATFRHQFFQRSEPIQCGPRPTSHYY